MTKRITYIIIICLLTFWTSETIASPQMPDYVIYGKDTIATYNLILEQYLQRLDSTETEQLFGLTFRDGASFNCWRGYQAIYKIEKDSLFLADIINCGELRNGQIDKIQSVEKIKSIFGNKVKNDKVFINWFNGFINFPLTNKVLRWDGVFYTIFEREKVITVSNGFVENVGDFDNYIDDPKRIDRRDKSEISDFLFKKLKRAKRKNLIRLDVDPDHAYAWSRSRMGGWAIAQSPILGTTITIERLQKRGYISLADMHNQLHSLLTSNVNTLFPMM